MLSRGNWMSITAPMHWTILPWWVWFIGFPCPREKGLDGGCAADDFRQFLGDRRLPRLVVDEREVVDDAGGVVARRLHRHHARRLLAGDVLRHRLVDDLLDVSREQLLEHHARLWLLELVPHGPLRRPVVAQPIDRHAPRLLHPPLRVAPRH